MRCDTGTTWPTARTCDTTSRSRILEQGSGRGGRRLVYPPAIAIRLNSTPEAQRSNHLLPCPDGDRDGFVRRPSRKAAS